MSHKAWRHFLVPVLVFGVASTSVGQIKPTPADVVESFGEDSSKVMFFARLAVSDHGGATLDPEHFLLGLVQQSPNTLARFVAPEWPLSRLEAEVAKNLKAFPKPPEDADVALGPRT